MDNLKVKFWAGWLNQKSMLNPEWIEVWRKSAEDAEKENCELVVFKIPRNKMQTTADPQAVEDIERMLQDKFGSTRGS